MTCDASGLITNIQFGNGNKTVYQYDGAGRMTGLSHGDTADTFASYQAILDESGYPVSIAGDFSDSSVADSNNISYKYNLNGTRLDSAGGISMTYDNEGQTTAKGSETYTFNVRHQLETVTGTGYQYQYSYDESGHRVKAVRKGVTTKYIYGSGSRILAETDSNGVNTRYYIYGHGLIGFFVPSTGFFACHYDMSGNMIAITDDTGAVAAKFSYTPFGEVIDSVINQPVCDIPVGFAGQFGVLREPNGLYYMNARYYDPSTGRFLSEDPVGLGGGDMTLYSYAGNNPVVFVDPSGLCANAIGNGVVEVVKFGIDEILTDGADKMFTKFGGPFVGVGVFANPVGEGSAPSDIKTKEINQRLNTVSKYKGNQDSMLEVQKDTMIKLLEQGADLIRTESAKYGIDQQ
jgi:RHS repeat-associated protein